MSNFCSLPFTHFSTRPNGDVLPCCRYPGKLGNIKDNSLEEIWNGEQMKELRKQFLANERPEKCWPCWQLEDSGGTSMRQTMNQNRNYEFELLPEQPFKIPVIELKLSNLCNFRCRTCKPDLSTTWLKDWHTVSNMYYDSNISINTEKANFFDTEEFLYNMLRLAPTIEILEFAGGEPLMDPLHYMVLNALKSEASHIEIKYSTNLSRLQIGKWDVFDYWKDYKSVDVSLSMDGYPDLNDYIRSESNTKSIEENLKLVRKELGDKFKGRIALCFSAFNAYYLPESYSYFVRELDMPVHGNIAYDPPFINPQLLPIDIKQKIITRYNVFRETINDMSKYHQKRIDRFLTTNGNYMMSEDKSHLLDQFLKYTSILDKSRNTNFLTIAKEFLNDMG